MTVYLLWSKMADDSSKLRAQITFLTNLIKSHKEVPEGSNRRQEIPATQTSNNNSHTAFSWQRKSQPDVGKKIPSVAFPPSSVLIQNKTASSTTQPSVKSSYSLDRRKQTTYSPDHSTTRTNSTVSTTSGSSGSSQTLNKAKPTEATNSSLASITTSASRGVITSAVAKPTISTGKPLPLLSTSSKSSRTSGLPHSSSSTRLVNSTSLTRNPYVLNKKETPSVAGTKTVAQKSELRWTRPSSSSFSAPKNVSSHSDSEVYTKKSKLSSSKQLSSLYFTRGDLSAMVRGKAPSTSNIQVSSYKWSRTEPGSHSNLFLKKGVKRTNFTEPRLKWTRQAGLRRQINPYVLKKSSLSSGKTSHKSRMMLSKTARTSKVAKMSPYSFTKQNSHVWRSGRVLKLDRRKSWSNAQSTCQLNSVGTRKSSVGFMERRQKAVLRDTCTPVVTRYSIVRSKRKQAPIKTQKSNKVIVIGGVPYKSSANKLTKARSTSSAKESKAKAIHTPAGKIGKLTKTVNIRGEKFVMDSKGKSLQRISKAPEPHPGTSKQSHTATVRRRLSAGRVIIGGITYLQTKPTTLVRSKTANTQNKTLASRVLRRSIQNARLYKKNKQKSASEQYCMFFNRFGKCNKRERCPYIHDPSKVAVCTKFLRGRCKNTDGSCPFSHKIDRDKMPVCQFFLRGKCFNDNCPYSHVNVSKKAEVCEDFLRGFCSRGQQCTKKHIIECEEFSRTGKCSRGKKCKLIHRTRKTANLKRKAPLEEERSSTKQARVDFSSDEGFLPLADTTDTEKNSVQGSKDDISADTEGMAVEPVVIRPRFLKTKESAEK